MPQDILKRARSLFRRRRFAQIIRLLESQIFRFRENPGFFFMLGTACLYSGDYGGAQSYLKRADQLKPRDAATMLGLAAIHARRGEADDALEMWLKIVELEPGNRSAGRGLEMLRRASPENLKQLFDSKKVMELYPRLPANLQPIVLTISLFAAAALVVGALLYGLPRLSKRIEQRPGVREVSLSSHQPVLAAMQSGSSFILSEKEVQKTFNQIKRYLLQYRDNLAVREINLILLSNASPYVKEKARLLKTFIQAPDFTSIKDSFSYAEVLRNPPLHGDCYVAWSGKVANVRVDTEVITFDLLVGYQDEKELQGVVPVSLAFAFDLENGIGIEVLGQIVLRDGAVTLEGRSIHRLYRY